MRTRMNSKLKRFLDQRLTTYYTQTDDLKNNKTNLDWRQSWISVNHTIQND